MVPVLWVDDGTTTAYKRSEEHTRIFLGRRLIPGIWKTGVSIAFIAER